MNAVAEVLTPLGVIATAAAVIFSHWRTKRNIDATGDASSARVAEVHDIVNSQRSDMLRRIEDLENRLGLEPGEDTKTEGET